MTAVPGLSFKAMVYRLALQLRDGIYTRFQEYEYVDALLMAIAQAEFQGKWFYENVSLPITTSGTDYPVTDSGGKKVYFDVNRVFDNTTAQEYIEEDYAYVKGGKFPPGVYPIYGKSISATSPAVSLVFSTTNSTLLVDAFYIHDTEYLRAQFTNVSPDLLPFNPIQLQAVYDLAIKMLVNRNVNNMYSQDPVAAAKVLNAEKNTNTRHQPSGQ